MRNLFTADPHWRHANIILHQNRPYLEAGDVGVDGKWTNKYAKYAACRRMDIGLIDNWNATVTPEDIVWLIGDFVFSNTADVGKILRSLNFKKLNFIWGNHDQPMFEFQKIISFYSDLAGRVYFLGDRADVIIEDQRIVLDHYAMKVWNGSHRGTWHLYGHSHGSLPDDPHSLSLDVGMDCHGYKPITFAQVKDLMAKKHYKPIDHHGPREEGGGIGANKEAYAKLERKRMYEQLKSEFEK